MAQPTHGYAANLVIQAFLRQVDKIPDEPYFDHSSKKGKNRWDRIKERFDDKCAYCGRGESNSRWST